MNIVITLDYELYFGNNSGTVENCIIKPTNSLLSVCSAYNVKLVFFIDVGFLIKVKENKTLNSSLKKDYSLLINQIKTLIKEGHEIGLHIHPHWEKTQYLNNKWVFDYSHYKLSDFTEPEAQKIVDKYVNFLIEQVDYKPISYRAGGWTVQPFKHINKALKKHEILIDSSVFPMGKKLSKFQRYDFTKVKPNTAPYNFNKKIDETVSDGIFTEYPIGSYKLSPLFFWKFAILKVLKLKQHKSYGDGQSISKSNSELLKLLTSPSYSVVSIDGFKSIFLEKSLKSYIKANNNKGVFVIIGHPKALSEFSLKQTEKFIVKNVKKHKFKTFKQIIQSSSIP